MVWFKRISLFILTNLLVMLTISISANLIMAFFGIQMPTGLQGLLVMCALFGFGGSLISLMISKWMAKRMYGVQVIAPNVQNHELRALVEMVHLYAKRAGLPKMPEVGIYESPEINAFATGPSKSDSLVAVSTGLLGAMNRDEVEGVIGHEISHIANGDMVTMTLIQGVVNTFVMFLSRVLASVIASSGNQDEDRRGSFGMEFMLIMVFDLLFGVLASILVNYFSRRREFRADSGGAKVAGREKMLAGLRKLQAQFELIAPDNGGAATFKISNKSSGLMALFSTHPPLAERIRRLERSGS
ncbi:MAG: protease HtpX [Pseudobdellovibrionaceae bacterium]